jgi:hypothetical protein
MSKTYDYFADGQLRFSSEALNHRFDRSYAYDHAARITQALSGAEARGEPTTNDRPYKQTFTYDGFSHLTDRNSNIWSSFYSTSDSYSSDRHTGWDYDADGRLLNNAEIQYAYDAAGRVTNVQTEGSTTLSMDGEGRQVKSVTVAYDESTQTNMTTIKFYVRSTVLGGQVLTELTVNGVKDRTFIYAGGAVLAWQEANFYGGPRVVWEHRDPSEASFRTTDINGYIWGYTENDQPAELDPTGANAGTHAPIVPPQEPPPDNGGQSLTPYPSFGDPRHPNTGYSVDGIPVSVDYFMMSFDVASHGSTLGFMEAAARPRLRNYEVDYGEGGPKDFGLDLDAAFAAASKGYTLIRNFIVPEMLNFTPLPQDTGERRLTIDEYSPLRSEIAKALKSEKCRKFIDTLVTYVSRQQMDSQEEFLALSDYMFNQPTGGIFWGPFNKDSTVLNQGTKILISGGAIRPDLNVVRNAETLMHELIHVVQGGLGSDDTLDKALVKLGIVPKDSKGQPLPFPTGMRDEKPYNDWSGYWDQALKNACFP